MFINIFDGVIKTPQFGYTGKGPFKVLEHDKQTMIIQQKELVGGIVVDGTALEPWPVGVPPIPL